MELQVGCTVYACKTEDVVVDAYEVEDYELPCGHPVRVLADDSGLPPYTVDEENAVAWADWLNEYERHYAYIPLEAVEAYLDNLGELLNPAADLAVIGDAYQGPYETPAEFAEEWFEEEDVPELLRGAIDWKKVWDYTFRYDYNFLNGYVFRIV